jgi:DNA mismatch endonuclease (patch repair protein)
MIQNKLRGALSGAGFPSPIHFLRTTQRIATSVILATREVGRPRSHVMADTFSKSQRSQIMRAVHSKGTGAENRCEALLRSLKLAFTRHADLPGQPDFILRASNLALFVHGCFWHAHKGCENAALPTSNVAYWVQKIDRNRRRDRRVREALRKAGWRTAVIWECRLRNADSVASRLLMLTNRGRKNLR